MHRSPKDKSQTRKPSPSQRDLGLPPTNWRNISCSVGVDTLPPKSSTQSISRNKNQNPAQPQNLASFLNTPLHHGEIPRCKLRSAAAMLAPPRLPLSRKIRIVAPDPKQLIPNTCHQPNPSLHSGDFQFFQNCVEFQPRKRAKRRWFCGIWNSVQGAKSSQDRLPTESV